MAFSKALSKNSACAVKLGGLVSGGASALGLLALFGCGSLGDRAMTGCPEGEVCSSGTPDGLRFYGASLDGTIRNGANTIAVGGTQTLRFEDAGGATRPLPTHTTLSESPEVISVLTSSNGSAVLSASAAGSARIRVVEPSGPLLDRISVSAAVLDRVTLGPSILTSQLREVAYVPGMRQVGIALRAADGTRLVDESALIDSPTVDVTAVYGGWDAVTLQLPTEGATLTVTTTGRTFDVAIPVAGPIDDIVINPFLLGELNLMSTDPLIVDEGGVVCFDLLSDDRAVIGSDAVFTFRVDGVALEGTSDLPCLGLPDTVGATAQIEVSAAGLTRSFSAQITPRDESMSLVSDELVIARPSRGFFGERASRLRGIDLPVLVSGGLGI